MGLYRVDQPGPGSTVVADAEDVYPVGGGGVGPDVEVDGLSPVDAELGGETLDGGVAVGGGVVTG